MSSRSHDHPAVPGSDARNVYVNAAFEATTGVPPSAVVGKAVEDVIPPESIALVDTARMRRLLHPDDLADAVAVLRRLRAGAMDTFSTEFRIRHLYGHWVWLRCHGRALNDDAGTVTRVYGTISDITLAKNAQEMMARASLVFAHTVSKTTE